jgi:hypothetical protein
MFTTNEKKEQIMVRLAEWLSFYVSVRWRRSRAADDNYDALQISPGAREIS